MLKGAPQSANTGYFYECETRRQHFNHLRNTSSNMRNCLTWEPDDSSEHIQLEVAQGQNVGPKYQQFQEDQAFKQKKNVSFDSRPSRDKNVDKSKGNTTSFTNKKIQETQNQPFNPRDRSRSANPERRGAKQGDQDAEIRARIREKQREEEEQKQQERVEKVKQYIDDLKPYTRSLTNTRYQDYFNKAALESYGRGNLKNAIGGIIYGNHQKTFNLNPHMRGNQPKYYQTHYTAINYGKRTKLNDQAKWNRLQKELTKKLGLKDKNQTLKQGKEVVYVDVDESNMHSIMKENLKFKQEHDDDIRKLEKDYHATIQQEKQAAVEEFYARKRDRVMSHNTVDAQDSTFACERDERERLQEQVIFRMTDKNGNVRLGADRHALTCFVDMNFPENSAAYTQQLIDRMPIYPVQVEEKDKRIDDKRRENYQKSLENIYPSHYLFPNCDQPQIIEMINNKYGEPQKNVPKEKVRQMGSTFGTTLANNSALPVGGQ